MSQSSFSSSSSTTPSAVNNHNQPRHTPPPFTPSLLLKDYHRGLRTFPKPKSAKIWETLLPKMEGEDLSNLIEVEEHVAQNTPEWDLLSPSQRHDHILQRRKKLVQSREALSLYQAFQQSQNESLVVPVLYCLSSEQFQRIIDLDIWQDDEPQLPRVMHWLGLCAQSGTAEVLKRYRSLEEECQIAILQPWVRGVSPEIFETLPTHLQDRLFSFPGKSYYYEILTEDHALKEALASLMELFQQEDMEYALALLAHLTWCPPHEAQLQAHRFAAARNEEDGFIPADIAWKSLAPLEDEEVNSLEEKAQKRFSQTSAQEASLEATTTHHEPYLITVMRQASQGRTWMKDHGDELIKRQWVYSANHVAAALQLSPREHEERQEILQHVLSSLSLALDILSRGNTSTAQHILEEVPTKTLLRYSYHLIALLRQPLTDHLIELGIITSKFKGYLRNHQYTQVLKILDENLLEVFDLEDCERIRGLFNRFPLIMIKESAATSTHLTPAPVEGAYELGKALADVEVLIWYSRLAYQASNKTLRYWNHIWWQTLSHVALSGEFKGEAMSENMMQKLLKKDPKARSAQLKAFYTNLPHLDPLQTAQGLPLTEVLGLSERQYQGPSSQEISRQRIQSIILSLENTWAQDYERAIITLKKNLTTHPLTEVLNPS